MKKGIRRHFSIFLKIIDKWILIVGSFLWIPVVAGRLAEEDQYYVGLTLDYNHVHDLECLLYRISECSSVSCTGWGLFLCSHGRASQLGNSSRPAMASSSTLLLDWRLVNDQIFYEDETEIKFEKLLIYFRPGNEYVFGWGTL